MSFWDNVKKFAQPYADDDYDDYDDDEYLDDDYDEAEEPAPRSSRRSAAPAPAAPVSDSTEDADDDFGFGTSVSTPAATASVPSGSGFSGRVVNASGRHQDVVLFRPNSFNDTSKAADDLRNSKALIVNMENVDKAMARRVVDFLSGCVYALNGNVRKIAQSAYLFCPNNVNIVGDLESIQSDVESYV